jgi:DNA-binding transcriptional ArsR family regulator
MPDPTAAIFRALGDPTRRAVFERLMRAEAAVGQLTAAFEVSQPAISQHLSVLKEAGLVSQRRHGRHRYYRAEPEGLAPLLDWLSHHQSFWRAKGDALKRLLEELE